MRSAPKLVRALLVNAIDPFLVKEDEKHDVIAEDRQAVQRGHLDDKGKQVVDDGVEELVGQLAPGQVRHTLHAVVQVQLRALQAVHNSTFTL